MSTHGGVNGKWKPKKESFPLKVIKMLFVCPGFEGSEEVLGQSQFVSFWNGKKTIFFIYLFIKNMTISWGGGCYGDFVSGFLGFVLAIRIFYNNT